MCLQEVMCTCIAHHLSRLRRDVPSGASCNVAHTCRVLYGEHTVLDLGETQTTGVLQRELS